MKTTTQKQMTTERMALGQSLLARTCLFSLQSITLAALERPTSAGTAAFQALVSQLPVALRHAYQALLNQHNCKPCSLHGFYCEPVHHIRGGNP